MIRADAIPEVFHLQDGKQHEVIGSRFVTEGFYGVEVKSERFDGVPDVRSSQRLWYYWNWNHEWTFSLVDGAIYIEGAPVLSAQWEIMCHTAAGQRADFEVCSHGSQEEAEQCMEVFMRTGKFCH